MLTSLTENVNDARKEMEGAETSLMVAENINEVSIDIAGDKMDDTSSEKYATTLCGLLHCTMDAARGLSYVVQKDK